MARLQITFIDNKGHEHVIKWKLNDSDLCRRWIKITKQNQGIAGKYINTLFINSQEKEISHIRLEMNSCIKNINQIYDEILPVYENIHQLTETELNILHEKFEKYGNRIDELTKTNMHWSEDMHKDFLKLNELIHTHEDLNLRSKELFPSMSVLYDYYPQELHETILEIDKIWLTSQFCWGGLYLGYNTLGKDWLKVCADNDIDVIIRNQVKPQKRFAAETWINFGPHDYGNWQPYLLESWYYGLPENIKNKVPLDNLNELTYGRFHLGQITIDNYFLKYDSDPKQWIYPDSEAKKKWNNDVLSTFVAIKAIHFMEEN